MLSVMSLRALAAGIMLVMSSGSEVMDFQLVPFVLYSMRFDTPVTVSLRVSSITPDGDVVAAPGAAMLFMFDDGRDAVAILRTITVAALSPKALLVKNVPVMVVHVSPVFMLYSIDLETPVILSVEPLYTTFGAALRAGIETARVAEANVVLVALTRT